MSKKVLTLKFQRTAPAGQEHFYEVVSVKNSTDYSPGQMLKKAEVETLCRFHRVWDVTIT